MNEARQGRVGWAAGQSCLEERLRGRGGVAGQAALLREGLWLGGGDVVAALAAATSVTAGAAAAGGGGGGGAAAAAAAAAARPISCDHAA